MSGPGVYGTRHSQPVADAATQLNGSVSALMRQVDAIAYLVKLLGTAGDDDRHVIEVALAACVSTAQAGFGGIDAQLLSLSEGQS